MKVEKRILAELNKCYSIAPLRYNGEDFFLVAAEKQDPCYLFDTQGNRVDTVWEGPGGVMSMVQVPGSNGQFLATHRFYSPNDSKEAKIVIVTPEDGEWKVHTLVDLPHVHRFDIVDGGECRYLIACALKSGHEYKDDWSAPGKVYAAELPADLSGFDEKHQLPLTVLKDNMLKNHGYYKITEDGAQSCVISADSGVFRFFPPKTRGGEWEIETLTEDAASDAVLVDLKGDGELELCVLSPFHGPDIFIYEKKDGAYQKVYRYPFSADFTHAIYGGPFGKKHAFLVGHREGERDLLAFTYDADAKEYRYERIDHDCGPANIFRFPWKTNEDTEVLIAANREINEIAMYTISELA
jgi:hypothetical protein